MTSLLKKWTDRMLLLDLFEGLKVTWKEFFKSPKYTVRYPEERMEPADRFRGPAWVIVSDVNTPE